MLVRSRVRRPLLVLLVVTALSWLCLVGGVIESGIGGYIGVLMQGSTNYDCTVYLTFKVETLNTYIYNLMFFTSCAAIAVQIALLACLLRLFLKCQQSEEEPFPQFSLPTFYLLYILYSLCLLLLMPGAGYYLTFIIEKGLNCTGRYELYWLTIGGLLILALLLMLACWILVLVLKLKLQHLFEQPQVVEVQKPPEVPMFNPTMKNVLDIIMMEQRIKDDEGTKETKEPLLESLDSDDQVSEQEGEKQKISYVGFGEYKQRQEQQRKKQQEEEEIILNLMRIEQEKREEEERIWKEEEERRKQMELKKKLSSMALSPDDENFEKMFEESQKEQEEQGEAGQPELNSFSSPEDKSLVDSRSRSSEPYYPANYVPVDEEDEKRFKKYKKMLLEKARLKKDKNHKRHLQNIEGGRSRRQLERMINAYKKPPRTIEYYQNMLNSSYTPPPIQEMEESQYSSSQDKESAAFNIKDEPSAHLREPPSFMPEISPPEISERHDYPLEQESPSRLLFEKRVEKSPIRKKLFEEESKYLQSMNMGSVLGTIVKGVIQAPSKTRLHKIREERDSSINHSIKRKNEKLIDFIRSKYS